MGPLSQIRVIEMEGLRPKMEELFLTRTRDEWRETFDETDACVAPVLRETAR
jgi:crotonobetainyl-CoA:carnitine CoA-transferase CaiB-like acyl-CoA transferase